LGGNATRKEMMRNGREIEKMGKWGRSPSLADLNWKFPTEIGRKIRSEILSDI